MKVVDGERKEFERVGESRPVQCVLLWKEARKKAQYIFLYGFVNGSL